MRSTPGSAAWNGGTGDPPAPVATTYAWVANRLISSTDGAGVETTREYDDLGNLTKITEPAPNAAARTDVPEAPAAPVTSVLSYRYLGELGQANCAEPASTGPVSTKGWCFAASELERANYADSVPAQRRITDFSHDAAGNLTRATERANPDPATAPGAPPSGTDRSTAFTYYARGGLRTIDGPRTDLSDITTWGETADANYGGFDRAGAPTKITDAAGKVKTFAYSPYGPIAKVVDRDGAPATSRYDEADNLVEAADPAGHTSAFRYDANDNRTRTTTPRGVATPTADDFSATVTYDDVDRPIQVSAPPPNPGDPRTVVTATYSDDGRVASSTNPRGSTSAFTTTYAYWPNRSLKSTDAPGDGASRAVVDVFYDGAGRPRRAVGPRTTGAGARPEVIATYNPDSSVAKMEATSPTAAMAVVRYAYNAHGEAVRADGPRIVAGVEQAAVTNYDRLGQGLRLRRLLSPDRWVDSVFGYDAAGNQTSISQPAGTGGRPTATAVGDLAGLRTATYSFDALGRLASQDTDPVNPGHTVAWAYTDEGLQTSRTDTGPASPGASPTTQRRVSTAFNPDHTVQSVVASEFATNKSLVTCNFGAGAPPSSGYDADGHLLETRTATATGVPASAASACDTAVLERRQAFSYNEAGWTASGTQAVRSPETGTLVTRTQSFSHAPDGQLSLATHSEPGTSFSTSYAYTEAGWDRSVTDWRGKATTTSYLASGAPASQAVGSGVASGSFDWHPDGSLKALTWRKGAAGAVVRSHTNLLYDTGAQRSSEAVSVLQPGALLATSGTASYGYDLLDRLTSWTSPFSDPDAGARLRLDYALDDAGNIATETATRVNNNTNRYTIESTHPTGRLETRKTTTNTSGLLGSTTTVTNDTYAYTGLGEESSRSTNAVQTNASAYDPMGHTASVDDRSAADADVAYVYDSSDQLISRHEPSASTDRPKATLYFHWGEGGPLVEESDGVGRTLVRYVVDPSGAALAQHGFRVASGRSDPADTAGTWKWLLPDADANVATHLLDTGAVAEQAAWDPYGRPQKAGSSQPDKTKKGSSLGFQGALTDRLTGSVVLGPRQYDPTTARFVTPDAFVGGELDIAVASDALTGNRYLFAAANPTAFFDDGHGWWEKAKKAGTAIGKGAVRFGKGALRNRVLRAGAAIGAAGAVCVGTAVFGCPAAVAGGTGAVLGGANYVVNSKERSAKRLVKTVLLEGAIEATGGVGGRLAARGVAAVAKAGRARLAGSAANVVAKTGPKSRAAPQTTRAPIRVNLGGEGEVARAINVQPARIGGNVDTAFENAQRVAAQSRQPVVMAEGNRLPFRIGSVDEVWTNNVPVGKGSGYFGPSFDPDEIFRILRPGGSWLGNSAP